MFDIWTLDASMPIVTWSDLEHFHSIHEWPGTHASGLCLCLTLITFTCHVCSPVLLSVGDLDGGLMSKFSPCPVNCCCLEHLSGGVSSTLGQIRTRQSLPPLTVDHSSVPPNLNPSWRHLPFPHSPPPPFDGQRLCLLSLLLWHSTSPPPWCLPFLPSAPDRWEL